MTDVLTAAKSLTKQTIGGNDNTWGTILNASLDLVDAALGQEVTVAIVGNTAISASQAQKIGYLFTGAPGGVCTVTWPTFYGPLVIRNTLSDKSPLICGMAGGKTITVPTGDVALLFSDGVDFVRVRGTGWGAWSVLDFGADPSGSIDATTKIQAAIDAIGAAYGDGELHFPAGAYQISAALTSTHPITLSGIGKGIGPGAATANGGSVITSAVAFTTGDMIEFNTVTGCHVRDLQFNGLAARTLGAAVAQTGQAGAAASGLIVERCAFLNQWDCVRLQQYSVGSIRDNYFEAWGNSAVYLTERNGVEVSGGFIVNNLFFGNLTAQDGILLAGGYTTIAQNQFIGCLYGVRVALEATTTVNAARITITDNIFEEQTTKGIQVEQGASGATLSMLTITDNEFSVLAQGATYQSMISVAAGAGVWIDTIKITGNVGSHQVSYAAPVMIDVEAGKNVTISDNLIDNHSASAGSVGIAVGTNVQAPIQVNDNNLVGITTPYSVNVSTIVRDMTGIAFAKVGPWNDGSMLRVTDGQATTSSNATLQAGGSGAIAVRNRGAWLALFNQLG